MVGATTVSGVTILLSLTVFLNLVAETLPQVSDAIPLLGTTEFLQRGKNKHLCVLLFSNQTFKKMQIFIKLIFLIKQY